MKFSAGTSVFWWNPATWLRVTGADAANFLQGQFTNDLRGLQNGDAVYGLWLDVKGKVVADSFVLKGAIPGEFWLGSYFSPTAAIRERLESFVIADDVVVEDVSAAWSAVTILGDGVAATLAGEKPEGFVFGGRRSQVESVEWVYPVGRGEVVRARLTGLPELSRDEMARRRIEAGIPAVPPDLGPGDLPNEGGLERDAISYSKGCYLGQEVMARLKSMGQVRRRLMRVAIAGTGVPDLPAALFVNTRRVGELRSAVTDGAGGLIGHAMVSLLHVAPGARLAFAAPETAVVTAIGP